MITITHAPPDADARIESLLDRAFGPTRHLKTAQRLRDGRLPAEGLAFIAHDGANILGTISFWHVRIGHSADALLLGPMAVEPALRGQGIGIAL
ncbi:MAG TPA: N-acetyltransferase, partial [Defluviicoccus sp.]|nr:N-acetyltransferase [Defluviicoccus sp.]